MRLDVVSLDDVRADTNSTDRNIAKSPSHFAYFAILVGVTRKVANHLPGNPKCTMMSSPLITSRQTSNKSIEIYQQLITLRLAILVGVTRQVANQLPRNRKFTLTPSLLMTQGSQQPKRQKCSKELITLRFAILVGINGEVANQLPGNPKCTLTPTILMTSRALGRHQPNRQKYSKEPIPLRLVILVGGTGDRYYFVFQG